MTAEILNSPIGSYGSTIKNLSQTPFFGITIGGNLFTLYPDFNGTGLETNALYLVSHSLGDMTQTRGFSLPIENRYYPLPSHNNPTYVEELSCVVFESVDERTKALEKYGSGSRLIKSYAAGALPIINGSYVAITFLNEDKTYYTLTGNQIVEIPREKPEYVRDCMKKYGLDPAILSVYDVFIMNQIVRKGQGSNKDVVLHSEIKKIARNAIHPGEPLIFDNSGFMAFDSEESAKDFIEKYGNLSSYVVNVALRTTHAAHARQIAELNIKAKNDKKDILEMFGIMGGTSVMSILAENVIKSSMDGEKSEETFKKALKIFAIGALGVGSVYGLYRLYKRHEQKKRIEAAASAT